MQPARQNLLRILSIVIVLSCTAGASLSYAGPREQAKRMHDRLVGVPPSGAVIDSMAAKISGGDGIGAALEAMDNPDDAGSLAGLDDDDISSLAGTALLWHAVRGCLTLFLSDISLADMLEDDDALVETGAPHARTVH